MTEPEHPEGTEELRAALAAERAGAEHWRRVARQREAALAEVKSRTSVRAVLSLDRRTAPLRAMFHHAGTRARAGLGRAGLAAGALTTIGQRGERQASLHALVDGLKAVPADPRSRLLIVIGVAEAPDWADRVRTNQTEVQVATSVRDIARVARGRHQDLIVLAAGSTEPLNADWLERLSAAIHGSTVAATGVLVHPSRPMSEATDQDLLVWSAGLTATVDPTGIPGLAAVDAGRPPADVVGGAVLAATSGWLAVDRRAYDAAGGLADLGSMPGLDASFVDLCVRLQLAGSTVTCVPEAVALDHRSLAHRDRFHAPVDTHGSPWKSLIDRVGPALVRSVDAGLDRGAGTTPSVLRLAITVASPSAKVARQWGDWHLAEAMAGALRHQGHQVTVQTLAEVDGPASRSHDVQLVLRGLGRVARTAGQRHVLWIISHPEDIDDAECDAADLVLVASERFASHLRTRTATPVEVLLQATDPQRFRPLPVDRRHQHPVTVVAKSRDVLRPAVRDALEIGVRPAIYGSGWEGLVDPTLVVAQHVDNEELPAVYSSAGVVLNDHWATMRAWGFVSNRIFDVLACGTAVVSDRLPEIADLFGELVPTWSTPRELGDAIIAITDDNDGRSRRREQGRALIVEHHSFEVRAGQLIAALRGHGLF